MASTRIEPSTNMTWSEWTCSWEEILKNFERWHHQNPPVSLFFFQMILDVKSHLRWCYVFSSPKRSKVHQNHDPKKLRWLQNVWLANSQHFTMSINQTNDTWEKTNQLLRKNDGTKIQSDNKTPLNTPRINNHRLVCFEPFEKIWKQTFWSSMIIPKGSEIGSQLSISPSHPWQSVLGHEVLIEIRTRRYWINYGFRVLKSFVLDQCSLFFQCLC